MSQKQRNAIDNNIVLGLGTPDDRLPTGVCTTCRFELSKAEEGSNNELIYNLFNYRSIIPPMVIKIRQTPKLNRRPCTCTMSKVGTAEFPPIEAEIETEGL